MIHYEDREKYYTDLKNIRAFYAESMLWSDLARVSKDVCVLIEKKYDVTFVGMFNEARFMCVRLLSDDYPSGNFIDKYITPMDNEIGEENRMLCHTIVYVLLHFSTRINCHDAILYFLRSSLSGKYRYFDLFGDIIRKNRCSHYSLDYKALVPMEADSNLRKEEEKCQIVYPQLSEAAMLDLLKKKLFEESCGKTRPIEELMHRIYDIMKDYDPKDTGCSKKWCILYSVLRDNRYLKDFERPQYAKYVRAVIQYCFPDVPESYADTVSKAKIKGSRQTWKDTEVTDFYDLLKKELSKSALQAD